MTPMGSIEMVDQTSKQTDRQIVDEYKAWEATMTDMEAWDREWTPDEHKHYFDLWSLCFTNKDKVKEAAIRLIDDLTAAIEQVLTVTHRIADDEARQAVEQLREIHRGR